MQKIEGRTMNIRENHNPMEHFQQWFYEVDTAHPEDEANAMLFTTVGEDGFPKSRIVLLKKFTWEGFIFFTNYHSEKGKAIAYTNNVCISFNWMTSGRQIMIEGKAEKIAKNMAEGYFESRPKGSQLSAWASQQSQIIASRDVLDNQLKKYAKTFNNTSVPKPEHWGGYIIKPLKMSFTEKDSKNNIYKSTLYSLLSNYSWTRTTFFEYI
ncbi:pyridoxamine 5'-phosphate oxidase [Aquimarina sp. U1-2]|uniref:pyridoxamine 5'-phosphate oxidase n=1 Tax=Aquimarina sp. U1-2 TaxID=2823141 RepID=UPI001AEC8038|nr:pyridoxamine 5'-phosphate oxidase [Aquimarina sp. U1-2]MBP2831488.1 pyridoxamine 5'-phosphate oxidase [Aquimarina sp. U1-2]